LNNLKNKHMAEQTYGEWIRSNPPLPTKDYKKEHMTQQTDHNGDFNKMGKRIELFYTISDFESFVNRTDIKIIQVDVKGVEPSPAFQQGFFAVVFYEQHFDKKIITNHIGDANEMMTAVESLINQVEGFCFLIPNDFIEVAKEMEKQQHGATWDAAIKAHDNRWGVHARSIVDFDEWYEQQFKK